MSSRTVYFFTVLFLIVQCYDQINAENGDITCVDDKECVSLKNYRCSDLGICICKRDYFMDTNACLPKHVNITDECVNESQCNTTNAICKNGTCVCEDGYRSTDNYNCYKEIEFGQPCSNETVCKYQKDGNETPSCVNNVCNCTSKYSPRENNSRCVEDAEYGEDCEDDDQCQRTDMKLLCRPLNATADEKKCVWCNETNECPVEATTILTTSTLKEAENTTTSQNNHTPSQNNHTLSQNNHTQSQNNNCDHKNGHSSASAISIPISLIAFAVLSKYIEINLY